MTPGHAGSRTAAAAVDAAALEAELRRRCRGEVRFAPGDRALYSTDASNYRQVPIGVVVPRDVGDVIEAVATARRHGAPVTGRGGGTSLAGQTCNATLIIDTSKHLDRVLEIDAGRRRARVEPGLVLDELRAAAERHGLTFGPDPATHAYCTLGGMIGNDSCGVHSVTAGRTADNVEELEILTYDGLRMRVGATSEAELDRAAGEPGRRGEIYTRLRALRDRYADRIRARYPKIPRRVSGYNLDELLPERGFHVARALVGTESTCVLVLEATVRLVDKPPGRALLVLGFPDVYTAADRVPEVLEQGPAGLEGMDDRLVHFMRKKNLHLEHLPLLPAGAGWLVAEFAGADDEEAGRRARAAQRLLSGRAPAPDSRVYVDREDQRRVWEIRESGLGATAFVPGEPVAWEGWEDSAVPPERLGSYLRDLRALLDRHGYACTFYGHFGQGCVHTRIDFGLDTRSGVDRFLAFLDQAADLVVSYGGSLSGEHGDGQSRAALLPKMFGQDLVGAFREFKSIWDPEGRMNPGKVVDPYRPDENLRLDAPARASRPITHFSYPEDQGSLERAALRCVGVGKCRRLHEGVMCPSFMVTREEKHSTRGRARLLFEMLRGEVLRDGWRSRDVREALDLCLACKGCKGECPVSVDVATYKAEFYAHHYAGRLRPRSAYSMGLITWWARAASRVPRLANLLTQREPWRGVAQQLGGIARQRRLPPFARQTFRRWFAGRRRSRPGGDEPRVLLWPDTFHNYFLPEIAQGAVRSLEAAGFRVEIPPKVLCCGRPLYDFGMLGLAKRLLSEVLTGLRDEIEDARRLASRAFTVAELMTRHADDRPLPRLSRRALVHAHCHHRALFELGADKALLQRLGLDYQILDSGCCGMAGAFGFECRHYEISMAIGERVLLPAVRRADPDVAIVADGFSCRQQIEQATGRKPLHLAELVEAAYREGTMP